MPSSGYLPDLGIEPGSPALQADSLPTELLGKPLYNKGNYIQYPLINHNGKEYEKEYTYV